MTLLAGNVNSKIFEGDTADAFGRTKWDEDVLYAVTNGGIAGPVPGTKIMGGKVIAVDVQALLSTWFLEKEWASCLLRAASLEFCYHLVK